MTGVILQSLVARVIAMSASLLVVVMASRALGPEGKGRFSYLLMLLGVGLTLGNLGLGAANVYFSAREPSATGRLVTNSLCLALACGLFAALIIPSVSAGFPRAIPFDLATQGAMVLAITVGLAWSYGQNILVGAGRVGAFNALTILYSVMLAIGMGVVLLRLQGDLLAAAVVQSMCYCVVVLALLGVLWRNAGNGFGPDRRLMGRTLGYGLVVYVSQTVMLLTTRVDLFMVQYRLSASDLGLYSLASDFCSVLVQLQAVVNLVLFPLLAREANLRTRLKTTYSILLKAGIAYVLVLGGTYLVLEPAVALVFGVEFTPAARAIAALMPGTVFLALASILQNHLGAAGLVSRMVVAPLVALPVNAAINFALTDALGIRGAALAATISYGVLLLVAGFLVWHSERQNAARLAR